MAVQLFWISRGQCLKGSGPPCSQVCGGASIRIWSPSRVVSRQHHRRDIHIYALKPSLLQAFAELHPFILRIHSNYRNHRTNDIYHIISHHVHHFRQTRTGPASSPHYTGSEFPRRLSRYPRNVGLTPFWFIFCKEAMYVCMRTRTTDVKYRLSSGCWIFLFKSTFQNVLEIIQDSQPVVHASSLLPSSFIIHSIYQRLDHFI